MTLTDCSILQKCYDEAVKKIQDAAIAVADEYACTGQVTKDTLNAYKISKLGVESTGRDLEYCLNLEIQEINGEMHA